MSETRRRARPAAPARKLEELLPAIAGALDVRVVFPRMPAVIQEVIPHETLALALLTPDRQGVRSATG